jgi:hypothetical protein
MPFKYAKHFTGIRGKLNRENKSRISKFELSYFLSNFNADFCKMIIFMAHDSSVEGEEHFYFGVNRSKVKVTITMNRIVENRIVSTR